MIFSGVIRAGGGKKGVTFPEHSILFFPMSGITWVWGSIFIMFFQSWIIIITQEYSFPPYNSKT